MIYRRLFPTNYQLSNRFKFGVNANKLTIGVPKEVFENERRVAITPDTIQRMVKKNGCNFLIESGAGL
jgi:NAD(P) transhydrogenase